MPVNFNFTGSTTPPAGTAVHLAFGTAPTLLYLAAFNAISPATSARLASARIHRAALGGAPFIASLSALALRRILRSEMNAGSPLPLAALNADWESNVWRGTVTAGGHRWECAQPLEGLIHQTPTVLWSRTSPLTADRSPAWDQASAQAVNQWAAWRGLSRLSTGSGNPWEVADPRVGGGMNPYRNLDPRKRDGCDPWTEGLPIDVGERSPYDNGSPIVQASRVSFRKTRGSARCFISSAAGALPQRSGSKIRWDRAILPPIGISPLPPEPPGPEPHYQPPYGLSVLLNFRCLWVGLPNIHFRDDPCPQETMIIPIRRVYFVLNTASLVRLPDRTPIPAQAISVAIDMDSWAWSLRATLAGRAAAEWVAAQGAPIEVEAEINGYTWTALVDSVDISRQFGAGSYSLSGRSRAAYLASPIAPVQSYTQIEARTLQQLAEAVLTNTGWTLDWTAPSWLVPGGVWSLTGTAIEALSQISEAAGAYLAAHRNADSLILAPRYAVLPWAWDTATPAVEIPASVVVEMGWRPATQPDYEAVYVSGQSQGILGRVIRSGTAGALVAPLIVDPLCTHVDAARARGGLILAQAGRQAAVSLSLPLSTSGGDVPLLETGQLIRVVDGADDWRGLVTGLSVSASRTGEALTIRQTAEVRRHYLG